MMYCGYLDQGLDLSNFFINTKILKALVFGSVSLDIQSIFTGIESLSLHRNNQYCDCYKMVRFEKLSCS